MLSFPQLKAWRQAFILSIPIYGLATVVPLFHFWIQLLGFILISIFGEEGLMFLAIAVGLLLASLLWYLLINLIYGWILKILWDKPPRILLSPRSIRKQLWHFFVALVSTLPVALIYSIYITFNSSIELLAEIEIRSVCYPQAVLKLFSLWLITAAMIYQFQLVWLKRNSQNQNFSNNY